MRLEIENKKIAITCTVLIILAVILFAVPFQYTAVEHRISMVPYEVVQQRCASTSFWTGNCNQWQYYTVTDYKEEAQDVKVTKSTSLFNLMTNRVQYYYDVRN